MTTVKVAITERMMGALSKALPDVGVVKPGPLHADPVKLRESITLREMDPSTVDSSWIDRRMSTVPSDQRRFKMADDELGGGQAWLLRGVAELLINLARDKSSRPDGWEESDLLKEQLMNAINAMDDYIATDDRRWFVMNVVVDHIDTKEQGGRNSWIWRYFVFWEASAYYYPHGGEGEETWL